MTQKELDVFIEHLLQVWKPRHVHAWQFLHYDAPLPSTFGSDYAICGHIELKERLDIIFGRCYWKLQFHDEQRGYMAGLTVNIQEGTIGTKWVLRPRALTKYDAQFIDADGRITADWHLIFRRNCWLSGANIECTDEEKSDWVQGYTYRQIDDWNSVLLGDERHLRF